MGKAFDFLTQHQDRFPQLEDYEGFDTRISGAMLLEHTPAMVLDLLNSLKYLPELIVINVGMSDFTRFSNSQQRANIKKMIVACKVLTKRWSSNQTTSGVYSLTSWCPYHGTSAGKANRQPIGHAHTLMVASQVWLGIMAAT